MAARTHVGVTILWLAAATVAIVAVAYALILVTHPAPPPPLTQQEIRVAWVEGVIDATRGIGATSTPVAIETAKKKLLDLRVTADDRETHLKLVMGLLAMERGESGAFDQYDAALADVPWSVVDANH